MHFLSKFRRSKAFRYFTVSKPPSDTETQFGALLLHLYGESKDTKQTPRFRQRRRESRCYVFRYQITKRKTFYPAILARLIGLFLLLLSWSSVLIRLFRDRAVIECAKSSVRGEGTTRNHFEASRKHHQLHPADANKKNPRNKETLKQLK